MVRRAGCGARFFGLVGRMLREWAASSLAGESASSFASKSASKLAAYALPDQTGSTTGGGRDTYR